MATVVTVIGLLATLAMPGIIKSRKASQAKFCINNLRQLEGAKTQWALDFRKNEDDIPTLEEVVPYLRGEKAPSCPADGTYTLRRVSRFPVCSLYTSGHTLMEVGGDDALPD
jgi:type II secretory pathway pseudopilin PulG